jgi:hypothetical protein
MKRPWRNRLILSLAVLAAGGIGIYRPTSLSAGEEDLGAPIAQAGPDAQPVGAVEAPSVPAEPAVQLDRPVVVPPAPVGADGSTGAMVDAHVRPTALFSGGDAPPDRGAGSRLTTARPMPVGPVGPFVDSSASPSAPVAPPPPSPPPGSAAAQAAPPTPYTWRQPPAQAPPLASPTQLPAPTPLTPPPGGTIVPHDALVPPGAVVGPGAVVPPGAVVGPGGPCPPGGPGICDPCPPCCPPGCPCGGGNCCDGCCPGGCCDCGGCGCWGNCCPPGNRFYLSAEYLLWWMRGVSLPPLVTAANVPANPDPTVIYGALGQPGTTLLYGNNTVNNGPASGLRVMGGWWFGEDHCFGLELGGFFLGPQYSGFTASSNGGPGNLLLGRPFFNTATGAPDREIVAGYQISNPANVAAGMVSVFTHSFLWGAQANARTNLCCGCNYYVDLLAGFLAVGLDESLTINENILLPNGGTFRGTPVVPGTSIAVSDHVATRNTFYGGQIGGDGEYRFGRWNLGLRSTIAFGTVHQVADIQGFTTITAPGSPPQTLSGGLLALPSNIGHHSQNRFAVIPQVTATVGYQFTDHLRGFVGYNFLYWSTVLRPGNQLDTTVNPNLIPPPTGVTSPARPAFHFNGSDFWAQGIIFGLEYRW